MVGGSIGAALFSLERFVLRRNAGGLFGRLPFLPYLALRSLLYAGVILVINAVVDWLMSGQFMVVVIIVFLFSLGLVVVGILLFWVNVLLSVVRGPSSPSRRGAIPRPRIEERSAPVHRHALLDLRSLSACGRARLSERLLNRFIVDLSLAIAEAGGEIHKYVGDEVIATSAPRSGHERVGMRLRLFCRSRPASVQRFAYEREFGLVADFRAGLHCGPVAVGELGYPGRSVRSR